MSKLQPLNNSGQFQPGNAYRWQPGDTPNPGGNYKNTPHADAAYARLGSLPLEQLKATEPKHSVEGAIKRSIIAANEARDWKEAHAALKQLVLCLDGSPLKRQQLDVNINVEVQSRIEIQAYVLAMTGKTREQAISEVNAIYDHPDRETAIIEAIEAQRAEVEEYWGLASEMVEGQRKE